MAQIKFESTITVDDLYSGKLTDSTTLTVSYTSKFDQEYVLSDTAAVVIWDPTTFTAPATNFDFAYFLADGLMDIEFGTSVSSAASEFYTMRLYTDTPLVLGADESYGTHATGAAIGAIANLTTINKIRAVRPSDAAATVHLRVILAT